MSKASIGTRGGRALKREICVFVEINLPTKDFDFTRTTINLPVEMLDSDALSECIQAEIAALVQRAKDIWNDGAKP